MTNQPAKKPHPAARARKVAAWTSIAAFAGFTGAFGAMALVEGTATTVSENASVTSGPETNTIATVDQASVDFSNKSAAAIAAQPGQVARGSSHGS